MSLRFRRRIKIIPGVHLNLSRSGISTSIGVRGASMTFGKRGTYTNVGIPGTGISWRNRVDAPHGTDTGIEAATVPGAPSTPVIHHHLHWWKVAVFFVAMIAVDATKSDAAMGFFWIAWLGYWGFLLVRMIARRLRGEAS